MAGEAFRASKVFAATKDGAFMVWARKKLRLNFWEQASRSTRAVNYFRPVSVPALVPPILPGKLGT